MMGCSHAGQSDYWVNVGIGSDEVLPRSHSWLALARNMELQSSLILRVLTRPPSDQRGRKTCLPQDMITGATFPTLFLPASNPRTGGRPSRGLAGTNPSTGGPRYFLTWTTTVACLRSLVRRAHCSPLRCGPVPRRLCLHRCLLSLLVASKSVLTVCISERPLR